jgi:16S rRNA (cytosine1402-N4)-methyltransferase
MNYHKPVLISEVISLLNPQKNKIFIDATLGNGGHTLEILKHKAKVIAFDADLDNIEISKKRIKDKNLTIINDNFANMDKYVTQKVDGILFDLGLSVNQQKGTGKGFSFNDPESLDMRLFKDNPSAKDIVNTYSKEDLFKIISFYAQEKNSRSISQLIVKNRPFQNALELANMIRNNLPKKSKIDPATKTFMALRIFVNNEFENLKNALNKSLSIVKPGGIVCVISFHSGEDRIVKQFIRKHHLKANINLPSNLEIKENPLSRSSVLRSFQIA